MQHLNDIKRFSVNVDVLILILAHQFLFMSQIDIISKEDIKLI